MIPKLQDNPNVLKDFKDLQKRISAVTDPQLQQTLTEMFLKLKGAVRHLDQQHESLFVSYRLPVDAGETRDSLKKIRKTLEDKLKAWEKYQA